VQQATPGSVGQHTCRRWFSFSSGLQGGRRILSKIAAASGISGVGTCRPWSGAAGPIGTAEEAASATWRVRPTISLPTRRWPASSFQAQTRPCRGYPGQSRRNWSGRRAVRSAWARLCRPPR
jgi:hypothetical protein